MHVAAGTVLSTVQPRDMDIDPDPFMSPSTSQSTPATSTEIDLSQAQLTAINDKMNDNSEELAWKIIIERANDVSKWQKVSSTILMELLDQATNMDLKDSFIAIPSPSKAEEIVEGFDTKEFEEWKDGVLKGVKEGNWADLIQHRMYLLPWTPDRVQFLGNIWLMQENFALRPHRPRKLAGCTIPFPSTCSSDSYLVRVQGKFSNSFADSTTIICLRLSIPTGLQKAYNAPFMGSAASDLIGYLRGVETEMLYAKAISIVQSSGTGKSRMLTEVCPS
jgi:hypothetical protein